MTVSTDRSALVTTVEAERARAERAEAALAAALNACDRVREAFSFMAALNGAYEPVTVDDIRKEVNDALDWCLPAVHDVLDRAATAGPTPPVPCTGLTARWCPLHGSCTCEPVEGFRAEGPGDDDDCPLHSPESPHAADPTPEPDTPMTNTIRCLKCGSTNVEFVHEEADRGE